MEPKCPECGSKNVEYHDTDMMIMTGESSYVVRRCFDCKYIPEHLKTKPQYWGNR